MLGTLIKHEWKYIWKKMVLFLVVIVFATLIGAISLPALSQIDDGNDIGALILTLCGVLSYYGMIIVVSFGFLIILAVRFYKNIYGDEAYITHTLPATARQIYVSKVVVSSAAMLIISLGLLVSISMFMNSIFEQVSQNSGALSIFDVYEELGLSSTEFALILAGMIIVSSVANVTMIYCSIVLGQKWKKHKIVGAIVWYVVINFALSILGVICSAPAMIVSVANDANVAGSLDAGRGSLMGTILILATLINLIAGAVAYFIADHGITEKLNLD